jgi:DNA primase
VNAAAAAYYHKVLPTKIREQSFRAHYGFTDETVDTLKLGWADGHLFEKLRDVVGASRECALKTGLFVVLGGGHVEDFFRERLVFPYWKGGQVVYFIARATEYTGDAEWEKSKYKKLLTHSERHDYVSPTVANECFYNEDVARGAEELLITEGVTDCISALQASVPCISPVTTRFRKQDVPKLLQLTRHVKRVIICNDSEESSAGGAVARETAAALWAEGRDVRVAVIPRGPQARTRSTSTSSSPRAGPRGCARSWCGPRRTRTICSMACPRTLRRTSSTVCSSPSWRRSPAARPSRWTPCSTPSRRSSTSDDGCSPDR